MGGTQRAARNQETGVSVGSVSARAHIEAAIVASGEPEMDAAAMKAKSVVLSVAASHTKTGQYNSHIRIRTVRGKAGVKDRVVESTDPNAMQIEFGHMWVTPEGKRIKYVKGIRIFNRAFTILAR